MYIKTIISSLLLVSNISLAHHNNCRDIVKNKIKQLTKINILADDCIISLNKNGSKRWQETSCRLYKSLEITVTLECNDNQLDKLYNTQTSLMKKYDNAVNVYESFIFIK